MAPSGTVPLRGVQLGLGMRVKDGAAADLGLLLRFGAVLGLVSLVWRSIWVCLLSWAHPPLDFGCISC